MKEEKTVITMLTGEKYDIDKLSFTELKDVLDKTYPTSDIVKDYIPKLLKKLADEKPNNSMDMFKLIMLLQYSLILLDDLTREDLQKRHVAFD